MQEKCTTDEEFNRIVLLQFDNIINTKMNELHSNKPLFKLNVLNNLFRVN